MIEILLTLLLMMIASVAFSDAKISAISSKEQLYPMRDHQRYREKVENLPEKKTYFPEKHYDIHNIRLSTLRWINYDEKIKKILPLPGPYFSSADGSLDLESYDPKTGRYKFKFTIKPRAIFDQEMLMVSGSKKVPVKIKGDAIFTANNKPFMYVEGIATIYDDKLSLLNINTNKDNSIFKLSVDNDNSISIIPIEDIRVNINVED